MLNRARFGLQKTIRLNEGHGSMGVLRRYLVEHPGFIPLLGFALKTSRQHACGFDPDGSLPTVRHLTRMLRDMPNGVFQFLLTDTVRLIRHELRLHGIEIGECVNLDTKHILAWVKENNPKTFIEQGRYDKTQQPRGDPDCKLGCKRKHNRKVNSQGAPSTPKKNPQPAQTLQIGEYYWGYGSGVIVASVPGWGEMVLAELTQPFEKSDISYFFPLMAITEQQLGKKPRFCALDAAFDAFYVYEYFHQAGGFAAVPFSEKGKTCHRQFDSSGLPLCAAGLAMPLKMTYWDRTTAIIEYERGQYVCPLLYPAKTDQVCPKNDPHWAKGGCKTTLATSIGARIRHQLDRDSEAYLAVYKQRTATERINSQAKALGIERPHLRNGRAIANLNTLIYTLINLRLLQRIRQHQPPPAEC